MSRTALYVNKQSGGMFAVEDLALGTGERWYVKASTGTDSAGYGKNPDAPFATLAYALAATTASRGDIIYLMEGHAETIGAAGLAWNVAGVSIIGLGVGALRPTFTWHTTDAVVTVSGANVLIKNILTKVNLDEVVSMFLVTGAGVTFDAVDFNETTSAQAIQWMLTTAAADQLTVKNCFHRQLTAAGSAQAWIQLVGTDDSRIVDNVFLLTAAASTSSHLISGSTAVVGCDISRNRGVFIGATITGIITLVTGSSGVISDNRVGSGTSVSTATAFTGDGCYFFNNLWADTIGTSSGLLAPVADTDT